MRVVDRAALDSLFSFPELVEALREAFRAGIIAPERHHHEVGDETPGTLLLMPAWTPPGTNRPDQAWMGVKIVSVFPGNATRGLPSISGTYLLMSGDSGAPLAVLDGAALTLWRTAAASALAASYLARQDARRMVMVGAGALAPFLIEAHAGVRPIEEVVIWNRSRAGAERLALRLAGFPYTVEVAADLQSAVRSADIVSCATLSHAPLVCGEWLKAGAHLDLVGAFTPEMRESDDEAVRRARIYVDTRAGALQEAGDILQPMRAGLIGEERIVGDLPELCRGEAAGRLEDNEITLFKSVGTALEDLAAAVLAYSKLQRNAH